MTILLALWAPAAHADEPLPIPADELNNHLVIAVIAASHLVGRDLRDSQSQLVGTVNSLIIETPFRNRYRLTVNTAVLEHQPLLHLTHGELPSSVSATQLRSLSDRFSVQPYWVGANTPSGQAEPHG